jgi:mono/diheme cytochrome c family protein
MWKAALPGALVALFTIATFLTIGCTTILGPAICGIDRTHSDLAAATTVKAPARHAHYVAEGAPSAYRGRRNPFRATIGNVVEGARLYDLRCAVCHGVMGVGDGDGGQELGVPPADLSASLAEPLYGDDFFYWTISDGGSAFATDMPPFKNDLSEQEIGKILTFMRAAFADHDKAAPEPAPSR